MGDASVFNVFGEFAENDRPKWPRGPSDKITHRSTNSTYVYSSESRFPFLKADFRSKSAHESRFRAETGRNWPEIGLCTLVIL